jgi:hypothetical protein
MGIFWQGRYTMPFAVGVVIMAGFAIAESEQGASLLQRLIRPVAGALVIATLVAYLQYCRRFAVGFSGPILFFQSARWQPFLLPWPALLPLATVLGVVAGAALTRAGSPRRRLTLASECGPGSAPVVGDELSEATSS